MRQKQRNLSESRISQHPTFTPPLQVPVFYFHRQKQESVDTKRQLSSLKKGFDSVQDVSFVSQQIESMPRSDAEWKAIMTFWSRVVRNRGSWELNGEVYKTGWTPTAEEKGRC